MNLLESTQLSWTATFNSQACIGVFLKKLPYRTTSLLVYISHLEHIKIYINLPCRSGEYCIITEWGNQYKDTLLSADQQLVSHFYFTGSPIT